MLTVMGTLERPTSGAVEVAGRDVIGASDGELAGLRAHQIGFVFQGFHLQDPMTAVDNVATGMLYTGAPARERREAAAPRSSASGSDTGSTHRPPQLSGGERQRVAIARAMAKRPVDHAGRRAHREPRLEVGRTRCWRCCTSSPRTARRWC